ncbi:hypothetical protein [Dyadobacter sp. CY312]|uniref:hypothetical protein n=1 Tax=Dyadobacter sp. CY312 TaxID=2907303 RepID=UPI001F1708F2|nr:hypothetical protein [Dyadobacter sp. CY312]MCE7042275.1 hypothetical protein [Dyadobacter sp. CY312]
MKKSISLLLLFALSLSVTMVTPVTAKPETVKTELFGKKKKKFKGYKKPKSKKILGIFKRKSDCGCPNK